MSDDVSKRTIPVKTYLSAEEFVAFHDLAHNRLGLEDAAALRMWIKEAIERHAARAAAPVARPELVPQRLPSVLMRRKTDAA